MPAIKLKKAAAEHQAEKEREERERESEEVMAVKTVPSTVTIKPKEASIGGSLMKGLDANILLEKRKRTIPPSEQKLIDWMEANLESKDECRVSLNSLYDYFGEACSFDGTAVVDQPMFNKRITDKFGKAFALKESSPYKGLIKEKKSKGKGSSVKADTLKIKMKDIIEEAIKEAGNPVKGVRFFSLKQYIACNYPALRVDLRPAYLKVALERGVKYGYIQLVRGVGLAGYYRLPVDEEPDETEDKPAEKEGGEAEENKEKQNGDAEAPEGEKSEENTAGAAAAAPSPKKKSRKRKAPESEGGEEGEKTKDGEGEDGEAKKKKKKKTKRRRPRPDSYHAAPLKIEDTFALAMTYMCEPKQTSFGKIKKYITENYPHVDTESELKSAMESGERKGFWEHITGQGLSGTFQLMIDEFDPNSTDNVEDMICSAIIACNEPKQASSNLLKKYVMEFHPDFNVQSRPHLFKMALERALKKQMIIQLSGIGASGSFQMWSPFTPTPSLLAGEEDNYVEDIFTEKQEMYIPRGTKSRGGQSVRKAPVDRSVEARPKPKKRAPPSNRSASQKKAAASKSRSPAKSRSRSRGKVTYTEDEKEAVADEEVEEEVEEDEDEPPAKKKAKKSGKAKKGKSSPKPKKKAKKPVSRAQISDSDEERDEADDDDHDDDESEAKKKSKSKAQTETSLRKSKARPSYAEDDDSEDEDSTPRSKGRGRESSGSGRRASKVNYNENDEEEDADRPEYTPRKSKSRGGEDDEEEEPRSSPKKRGKKRR